MAQMGQVSMTTREGRGECEEGEGGGENGIHAILQPLAHGLCSTEEGGGAHTGIGKSGGVSQRTLGCFFLKVAFLLVK